MTVFGLLTRISVNVHALKLSKSVPPQRSGVIKNKKKPQFGGGKKLIKNDLRLDLSTVLENGLVLESYWANLKSRVDYTTYLKSKEFSEFGVLIKKDFRQLLKVLQDTADVIENLKDERIQAEMDIGSKIRRLGNHSTSIQDAVDYNELVMNTTVGVGSFCFSSITLMVMFLYFCFIQ